MQDEVVRQEGVDLMDEPMEVIDPITEDFFMMNRLIFGLQWMS
jgi:hypothetical protein